MERLGFIAGFDFDLIIRSEYFVIYWSPAIVFNALIPTFVLVFWITVKGNVDGGFTLFFFHFVVVTGGERIYIYYCAMDKNFVVD